MKFLKGQSNDDLNKFYKFDSFYRDQSLAWKWVKYIANINDNKHAFLLRFTDNRHTDPPHTDPLNVPWLRISFFKSTNNFFVLGIVKVTNIFFFFWIKKIRSKGQSLNVNLRRCSENA